MSVATDVAPERAAPRLTAVEESVERGKNLAQRAGEKVVGVVRTAWNGVKRFFGWLKRKVVAFFTQAKEVAVKAWDWTTVRAKRAWAWMKDRSKRTWAWTKTNAKRGWAWTKLTAIRARNWFVASAKQVWAYIAPLRAWVSTPLRAVMIWLAGLTGLSFFGVVGTVGIVLAFSAYVILFDGDGDGSGAVPSAAMVSPVNYTNAQENAVTGRKLQVVQDLEAHRDNLDLFSEFHGRDYFLAARIDGNKSSSDTIANEHQKTMRKSMGTREANNKFNWSAVKRAMADENLIYEDLMAKNAEILAPSAPTGAGAAAAI